MGYVIYYLMLFSLIPLALNLTYNKRAYGMIMIGKEFPQYRWNNAALLLAISLYSVFVGFAYETGMDYWHYYDHYVSSVYQITDYWGENREFGYQYFVQLLSTFIDSPAAFFISCALLNSIIWSMVSSLYGKASGYIMYMLYMYMFTLSLNLYRQFMAIAILLITYYYIVQKSKYTPLNKKQILCVIFLLFLAFFFHASSIIGIFLYMICYAIRGKLINKWIIILTICLFTVLGDTVLTASFSTLDLIINSMHTVLNRGYDLENMLETQWDYSRMTYVVMSIHVVYIWYADKVLKTNNQSRFLYYAMALTYILIPIFMQEILLRIRTYMTPFMCIALGLTLYSFSENKIKAIPLYIAFIVDFAYFCFNLYNHGINFPLQFKI